MTDFQAYDPPPTVDPLYAALMRGVVARHARDARDAADLVAMLGIERDTADGGGTNVAQRTIGAATVTSRSVPDAGAVCRDDGRSR